ncbi:MAG: efflux RND transporter periplasmic adaptor subunit [Bacteroidaceae bacterium]|nr:efflux RND transporter periplasmic adaptor subunit [Bacteroidaceae bacterium]
MKTKYLAMVALALTVASCGKKEAQDASTLAEQLPQVKLATVTSEEIAQTEVYSATVESDVKNNISPNAPMRIEKILVEVGDKVSKGQVLVQLDASTLNQLKLQISNQKTVLSNVTTEFGRIEELYKVGGVSKSDYDNARVQLEGQKTQLNVLETQYKQMSTNTQLLAPISGVVTARNYDNGDMYGGQPVLTIEQTNPVKVLCNVSEAHYKDVKRGQKVEITLDAYENEAFEGTVSIVYPNVDPATHTFPVEVTIKNPEQKVRPGMFARAVINFGSQSHVVVPDEALVKQIGAGDRYVYVYNAKDNTVSYNKVEIGRHMEAVYEILSGVQPGDQVVVAGHTRLANGKKVEVVK